MTKFISWLGTLTSIIGSFLVALHYFQFGYVCFIIGSASWLFVGYTRKDSALITMNLIFFLANILGLYNAF
jgi:uncharacterized membrane protein